MNTFKFCFFCISLFILTINAQNITLTRVKRIVGGKAAAIPPEDDPVIYVTRGKRYAEIYGERDIDGGGYYAFRGIRYGVPPFGQSRFQRPREMPLQGEIRATKWGPPCPQLNEEGELIGHEDCLFLNIMVPSLPETESTKYPVVIWIHGGGFRRGSASQYGMKHLIKKKMLVVSIQYRLGTLGFLSSGTQELPGNNGIFDMMLAVRWVRKHIEFFGGDVSKINVFGHEVGASSALIMGLSKLSNDNLNGVIAMSGSALSNFAIDREPAKTAQLIAAAHNCTTSPVIEMVRCLKNISVDQLVKVDHEIDNKNKGNGFIARVTDMMGARPVIEGLDDNRTIPNFTPISPENSLSMGDVPNIPLLIGVNKREAEGAILGDQKEDISSRTARDADYFNRQMIPKLQKKIPVFNSTKYFVPQAFSKYVKVYDKAKETLESIADAVVDALFNAPAYLTAKYWAKKGKVIFYSFDHKGKRKEGSKFLAGSPFVSKSTPPEAVSHGDDLGYIFDRNTLTGERVAQNLDQEDEQVVDTFTDMVAQFARSGNYNMRDKSKQETDIYFSEIANNYISIQKKPKTLNDFRYCEMGLWMGMAQRLQSVSCNFLRTTVETVSKVVETPSKVFEKVDSNIETAVKNVPTVPFPGGSFFNLRPKNNMQKMPQSDSDPLVPAINKFLNPLG